MRVIVEEGDALPATSATQTDDAGNRLRVRKGDDRAKRLMDISLAALMLAASAPLWPVLALAIKLTDGGRVFYRQQRWGLNGSRFVTLKFRSMENRASSDPIIRPATPGDGRVTKVGRLLRACGLDELPQLLNILYGDMSFVGPRALAVGEILEEREANPVTAEDIPGFAQRLSVRPGLTSLSTVMLPKDCDARLKFRCDVVYVRTRSLALDLKLIAVSLLVSFRGRWESREAKIL